MVSEVTLNDEGALVIPMQIREAMGLQSGSRLMLFVEGNDIVLTKSDDTLPVAEKDGLLVITAEPLYPIEDAIEMMREERMKHVLGQGFK